MKKLFLIALMAFSMIANAQNLHWTYNSHTQYNMTITGEMYLNGVSMKTNTDAQYLEIGIFAGDECRGAYLPTLNPASYYQGYAYLMQVYANSNGEEMNFKAFNHQTGEEMNVTCTSGFTFQSDANLGTLRNPYAIEFFTPCEITVAANPTAGGTVDGDGVYNYGSNVTLSAVANAGYTFVNWTKNNEVVSTEAEFSVAVAGNANYVANFSLNNYAITATANPTAGGTVTGTGNYDHFTNCTLTATAATGYTFANWTKNGQVVSTDAVYTFEVTAAGVYVANFTLNSYAITANATPTAGGTVTGAGTYNHGASATLTATAATGYTFTNWTKNGQVVSTNASYTFTVTAAGTYVANFTLNTYNVTVSANPTAGGTVTGAGNYNHGANCTLTATASASTGYHFVNWTKGGQVVSTNATYSFTVTEASDFVANFALNNYNITTSVAPTNSGIATGAGTYTYGQTATLTATAATGYTFTNWKKNGIIVSTNATYSFTVTDGGAYVANFALNTYTITATANPTAGGTITGAGTYAYGDNATLTATAATGYTFTNWTKNGQVVSTNASYTFTVTAAGTYVANFTLNTYNVTVSANPTAGGTVTGAGTYNHGASATLIATANTGYTFVNWTKNGQVVSTNASYTFTVTAAGTYVANFQLNSYAITVSANPGYAGTTTGAGTYSYGTSITLTATANTGFNFSNWTKNGQVVSSSANYTFTVTDGGEFVANFNANQYTVVTVASPSVGGTVTGGGSFLFGQTCTLNAEPAEGYSFVNWTNNAGEIVSTNVTYQFNVYAHELMTAHFSLNKFTISATASPSVGGTVEGAGSYNYGETATLIATPATGYSFVNWTKEGEEVSSNASYSFVVTESGAYVAHFSINSYDIEVEANPTEGGTVSGAGSYNYGANCILTATAAEGYNFVNWTKGNEVVTTNATYTFTVTENATYVANFEAVVINTYEIVVVADPENFGVVSGGGTYEEGEIVTVTAEPVADCIFVNWTENGQVVSEDVEYSFTATADRELVAHFEVDSVGEIIDNMFNVYPNPVQTNLYIAGESPITSCKIYNVSGEMVCVQNGNSTDMIINVEALPEGMYIIRVEYDNKTYVRRFIKE